MLRQMDDISLVGASSLRRPVSAFALLGGRHQGHTAPVKTHSTAGPTHSNAGE